MVIDPSTLRQRYSGIGFSLDETSVSNLWKLTPAKREKAIRLLVDPKTGAGFDRFRLTIGSPDLIEHLPFWSYDELPAGVTEDWNLKYFSIQRDIDLHIVDTVKLIQRYNPRATFFASAWSAPAWMKTNNRFLGEVALKPGSTTTYYQVGKLRDDAHRRVRPVLRQVRPGVREARHQGRRPDPAERARHRRGLSGDGHQRRAAAEARDGDQARGEARPSCDTELYVHDFNFWDWRDPNSTETKNYYRIFNDPNGRQGRATRSRSTRTGATRRSCGTRTSRPASRCT